MLNLVHEKQDFQFTGPDVLQLTSFTLCNVYWIMCFEICIHFHSYFHVNQKYQPNGELKLSMERYISL